jgi:histidinol-phosphatase (PHP family)
MKMPSDFHVHTCYCDGRDLPTEIAQTAYELGFHTLGFSGHSDDYSGLDILMDDSRAAWYRSEIEGLKEAYKGRMNILCGLELDYNSDVDGSVYDYVIGSVHNLKVGGKYRCLDHTPEDFQSILTEGFDGSFDRLAEAYYACVADVLRKTKGDIIGHLDLITKFQNRLPLVQSDFYLRCAFEAIHTLIPYGKPFEINVGAISRGYRTTPYPADPLLREIKACGGSIIFTGDCHDRRWLGKGYDVAVAAAKRCGFTEYADWDGQGFGLFPLK